MKCKNFSEYVLKVRANNQKDWAWQAQNYVKTPSRIIQGYGKNKEKYISEIISKDKQIDDLCTDVNDLLAIVDKYKYLKSVYDEYEKAVRRRLCDKLKLPSRSITDELLSLQKEADRIKAKFNIK